MTTRRPAASGPMLSSLDRSMLSASFDPRTIEKGARYHRERRVASCWFDDRTISGTVWGTAPSPYRVKAWVENGRVRTACSCPVAGNCKHGYALCLHWMKDRGACTDLEKLRTMWDGMERDDLIEVLLAVVNRRPEVLDQAVSESVLRSGGPGMEKALLDRVRKVLHSDLDTSTVGDIEDEIRSVLSSASERKESIDGRAYADLLLSMYEAVVRYISREDDEEGTLAGLAEEMSVMFEDACQPLDDETMDGFLKRALELFIRGGDEEGQDVVLIAVSTPASADRAVRDIDRAFRGRGRPGRSASRASMADRTAAQVLAAAGRLDDALARLSATKGDPGNIILAVDLLRDAGKVREAVDLLLLNRPTGSYERWAWSVVALEALSELNYKERFSSVDEDMVREVVSVALRDVDARSPGGPVEMARKLMDAAGGQGSFARLVCTTCRPRKAAWAFVKSGDVVRAHEVYLDGKLHDGELAWEMADAADHLGFADLRDEMVAEALRSGHLGNLNLPRRKAWTENALARMDHGDLSAFVDRVDVPTEHMRWLLKVLAKRDAELAAMLLDRRSQFMRPDIFLECLEELRAFPEVAVRIGKVRVLGLLISSRRYAEAIQVLREMKRISGMRDEDWSAFLHEMLNEHGGRKKLWDLISEEGW